MTPAERAARIADGARERKLDAYLLREWWSITRPDGERVPIFFDPPQTRKAVEAWYPGCKVEEGDG